MHTPPPCASRKKDRNSLQERDLFLLQYGQPSLQENGQTLLHFPAQRSFQQQVLLAAKERNLKKYLGTVPKAGHFLLLTYIAFTLSDTRQQL